MSANEKKIKVEEERLSKERVNSLASCMRGQNVAHYTKVPDIYEKKINIVMQQDGLFEVRFNKIGKFVAKTNVIIDGEDKLRPSFEYCLKRKIPLRLLKYVVDLFSLVNEVHGSEIHTQILWDEKNEEFLLCIPKQTASSASVDYIRDVDMERKYLLIMDIHSHNTMGAFFSGTDNSDEKEARLFGVIGNIKSNPIAMKLRAICNGNHINIPSAIAIFDFEFVPNDIKEFATMILGIDTAEGSSTTYNRRGTFDCYNTHYEPYTSYSPYVSQKVTSNNSSTKLVGGLMKIIKKLDKDELDELIFNMMDEDDIYDTLSEIYETVVEEDEYENKEISDAPNDTLNVDEVIKIANEHFLHNGALDGEFYTERE